MLVQNLEIIELVPATSRDSSVSTRAPPLTGHLPALSVVLVSILAPILAELTSWLRVIELAGQNPVLPLGLAELLNKFKLDFLIVPIS
jgi:hypothetical protein